MNYCTRAYSKQSICYLLERSQQQQNSSQKKESESVQNKESTVRKIQENTRLDKAEEDKLSGRLPPWGLTAWELTGPALSRGYESTKHQTETVLPFKRQKGAPNIVLSWLDSNYLHLQATDTFLVAQLAIPKHLFISEGSRTALQRGGCSLEQDMAASQLALTGIQPALLPSPSTAPHRAPTCVAVR